MGPPLNFFMTRLLFVDKNKVSSLKAKSDKAQVEIIVDNPKILRETDAMSLPPVPFPPAAPESPAPVEGWKGVKRGGWLTAMGGKKPNPPAVYTAGEDATTQAFGNLKVNGGNDDDDDTEITEESASQNFDVVAPAKQQQSFPANESRSLGGRKSGSIGRKLGMKKRSSKGSGGSLLRMGSRDSSPSSSGAED